MSLSKNPRPAAKPTPTPAYVASPGSILHADRDLYEKIAATAHSSHGRELIEKFVIPIRSGKAWTVPAGCICRISTPQGPQVSNALRSAYSIGLCKPGWRPEHMESA